jgi:WD40 repeat protein/serine/threonine protein kinase
MATVQISCPTCRAALTVDSSRIGHHARCKKCEATFVVPGNSETVHSDSSRTPRLQAGEDDVPPIWKPGDVILDLYEVKQVFQGGMGFVYRVRHRSWDMELAVKSPKPDCFQNARDEEDFEREARTWVDLGLHTHIVSCYYVRRLGGIPRIFAEYVEGGSLGDWIQDRRLYKGDPDKALVRIIDIAVQIAWGLHYAHEHNLVHQDMKPGNVLMTSQRIAKVTDFGLSRARGAVRVASKNPAKGEAGDFLASVGGMTPAYCSPEQLELKPLSLKTDMWSWAVTVLQMFTVDVLWSGGQVALTALKQFIEKGPKSSAPVNMPRGVASVLEQCFQKDPAKRPTDMLEAAGPLQDLYEKYTGGSYWRRYPKAADAPADNLNNRAVSLLDLDEFREAERLWEQALSSQPLHLEANYNLALIQCRLGRKTPEQMLQRVRELEKSRPGEWLPSYLLARAFLECDEPLEAIQAISRIEGEDADRPEVQEAMAQARDRLAGVRESIRTFQGHGGAVTSLAMRSNGRLIISGSEDASIRVWDTANGNCLRILQGHAREVESIALTKDGAGLLSGSQDRTLKLWNLAKARCVQTYEGHEASVLAVGLTPDGKRAVSGSKDETLRLWDLATGKCLRTFKGHRGAVRSVYLHSDGVYALAGGDDGKMRLWELDTGRCVRVFSGHEGWIGAVCLTRDGTYALSGGEDQTVRAWEVDTEECLFTLKGHAEAVRAVCVDDNIENALSGSADHSIKVWDLTTQKCTLTLQGHHGAIRALCINRPGSVAISGGTDQNIKLWNPRWDAKAPSQVCRVMSSEKVMAAKEVYDKQLKVARGALEQDDALTAVRALREARALQGFGNQADSIDEWCRLYSRLSHSALKTGWEVQTLSGHNDIVLSAAITPDGRYALSASKDRNVKFWMLEEDGRCRKTLKGHTHPVFSVCLSNDGKIGVSGSGDKTIRVWNLEELECDDVLKGHEDAVRCVNLSADRKHIVSGGDDGVVRLWDVSSGKCLQTFKGHKEPVRSVSFSPDTQYVLSGSEDQTIRLWDVVSGKSVVRLEGSSIGKVFAVCMGSNGRHAMSADNRFEGHEQLKFWDLQTGRSLQSLEAQAEGARAVCLAADLRFALSGHDNRTMKLWDLRSGSCVRTFEGHEGTVTCVTMTPDGRFALTGSADKTLKVWFLDWDLEENEPGEWDEGAEPYLEAFLTLQTPYKSKVLGAGLTRSGEPIWTAKQFDRLLETLGCAGYGWLTVKGVRKQLERMASQWQGPPPFAGKD